MIKGKNAAACFMDVPFASLKYVLTPENTDPQKPRYEPYGIAIHKKYAYRRGCRPVLYLSDSELRALNIPSSELWRVVKFEVAEGNWISWLHEREWRCKGNFKLPNTINSVLVRTSAEAKRLTDAVARSRRSFKCVPKSVVPCTVLCQGLLPAY